MHFSSVDFGTVLLQMASNFGRIWRGTAHVARVTTLMWERLGLRYSLERRSSWCFWLSGWGTKELEGLVGLGGDATDVRHQQWFGRRVRGAHTGQVLVEIGKWPKIHLNTQVWQVEMGAFQILSETWAKFEVQLWKASELVFLVKWVMYQGARGFGWARWRRHRCSTSAVIWTASPRCSHGAGPYFMVFPCFSHQGKGKTWYMDSVQSTGWLQVKSA